MIACLYGDLIGEVACIKNIRIRLSTATGNCSAFLAAFFAAGLITALIAAFANGEGNLKSYVESLTYGAADLNDNSIAD